MVIAMTAFEKNLEKEINKLNAIELNEKDKELKDLEKEKEEEIIKLEKMQNTYEEGIRHIQKRLEELRGPVEVQETYPYDEEEMKEFIQLLVERELKKKFPKENSQKEKINSEENLVIENAIAKRQKVKNLVNTNQKDRRIKDYRDLSRVGRASGLNESDEPDVQGQSDPEDEDIYKKVTLLGNYWKEKYQNLLFTSLVIDDVAKAFTQKEFLNLDRALGSLNNEKDLERKKISPENEDYYFSFLTLAGVKSRIFYQIMPKDFGNRRIVVTRVIKQYYTRSVN